MSIYLTSTNPRERYSEKKKKEIVNVNEQKMAPLQPSLSREKCQKRMSAMVKQVISFLRERVLGHTGDTLN